MSALETIARRARACTVCLPHLPLGARPLFQVGAGARILIIGQAPGRIAHEAGIPWNDQSGRRLRDWLGVTPEQFYDPELMALLPMGFCFPGKGAGGDLAPRPECAPLWHPQFRPQLRRVALTISIGAYAFSQAFGNRYRTMSEAIRDAKKLLPVQIILPHPSPRNGIWLSKNPWFAGEIIPALRRRVRAVLES